MRKMLQIKHYYQIHLPCKFSTTLFVLCSRPKLLMMLIPTVPNQYFSKYIFWKILKNFLILTSSKLPTYDPFVYIHHVFVQYILLHSNRTVYNIDTWSFYFHLSIEVDRQLQFVSMVLQCIHHRLQWICIRCIHRIVIICFLHIKTKFNA